MKEFKQSYHQIVVVYIWFVSHMATEDKTVESWDKLEGGKPYWSKPKAGGK